MNGLPKGFLPLSQEISSFLQQIKGGLQDEELRLIFADWLEEQGDPRGELLRIQCEMAQKSTPALIRREKQLWQSYERSLMEEANWINSWEAHRGLLSVELWLEEGSPERWKSLMESHHWPWLYSLVITSISQWELERLPEADYLSNFTSLYLGRNGIGDKGARIIAQTPYLANLTELVIPWNGMGRAGADAIARSPHFANLRELYLQQNRIRDKGAQAIAESRHLVNLEALSLRQNQIGEEGAMALAESRFLHKLTLLDLGGNKIGDEAKKALRDRFGSQCELRF